MLRSTFNQSSPNTQAQWCSVPLPSSNFSKQLSPFIYATLLLFAA